MPARERHKGRLGAGERQLNPAKQIALSLNWTITIHNNRTNHLFREGVSHLVDTQNQRSPENSMTIADAQQQILLQTGCTVSHCTAVRWIAKNNLGYKLPGHRGQWIVDRVLFEDFFVES